MKKDIYKEIPKQLHQQFMETVSQLSEEEKGRKVRKLGTRKMIVGIAAIVAAFSTLTVGATALYRMHRTAAEQLGVNPSLAEQLVTDGVAKEESVTVSGEGLRIQALQTVYRENSVYLLLDVEVPEEVTLNEDVLFEHCEVSSEMSFAGCVDNMISSSIEGNHVFWEVELLFPAGEVSTGEDVTIRLTNLVQTEKTLITDTLVEGVWELPIQLPAQADTCVYLCEKKVVLGNHLTGLKRVEAGPFGIQLYLEQEDVQHCLQYQNLKLTAVKYTDGRQVKEEAVVNQKKLHKNQETGDVYVELELVNAIEVDKLDALMFSGNQELSLLDTGDSELPGQNPAQRIERTDSCTLLYEKQGHELWTDGANIYLEDTDCGMTETILDLQKLSYDVSKGGEIAVGPGGNTVIVLPYEDSENVYIGNVAYGLNAEENVHRAERSAGWPEENFRIQ